MKILVAASGLTPLISTNAQRRNEAVRDLPLAFQLAGHEVSVVGPLTPGIENHGAVKFKPTGVQITLPLGHKRLTVQVAEARTADGLQMFLLRQADAFAHLADGMPPDAPAAVLFSKTVVELARRLNPAPDVIQIQDWPGALVPIFLKTQHLPFASALTISDPGVQGSFPVEEFGLLNLGWEHFRPTGVEFYGRLNFLKSGIVDASAVVAAGDLERDALQTPEFGGGLDAVLRENAGKLHGIPLGLDDQTWNPAKDAILPRRYQPSNLSGKPFSRNVLLASLGLARNPTGPVFLLDTAAQDKTLLDLLAAQIDQVLASDARFLVMGRLPASMPATVAFETAARKHPAKFALIADPDERLRHLALAAADFQLLLGCSLHTTVTVLRGLKYGVLPIAPASPGLKQVAEDHRPGTEGGYGLAFYHATGAALFDVLAHRAPALLTSPESWESVRQQAMIHAGKFTWARTAAQYVALYGRLTQ